MARTCSRREIKRVESIIPNRDFTVRASRETRKLKGRRNIHFFSRFSNSEFQCTIIIIFPESFLHRSFSRCFFHSHEKKKIISFHVLTSSLIFDPLKRYEYFFLCLILFFFFLLYYCFSLESICIALLLWYDLIYTCVFLY